MQSFMSVYTYVGSLSVIYKVSAQKLTCANRFGSAYLNKQNACSTSSLGEAIKKRWANEIKVVLKNIYIDNIYNAPRSLF